MFDRGRLQPGETILVHGGTSGIGTTAIELAKAFGGQVSPRPAAREVRSLAGARRRPRGQLSRTDFVAEARGHDGRGADVILDMVGGDYIARNTTPRHRKGALSRSPPEGSKVEIDLRRMMLKRLTHTGSTLRPRRRRKGDDRPGFRREGSAPASQGRPASAGFDLRSLGRRAAHRAWKPASISARSS